MTVKISANANGTEGSLDIGATPVSSFTQAGGVPFMKNILINGNMRINQRGVTIAAAANGSYGPDRWKKVDASNMTQIVEEFNYRPNTVYTLSGTNVTTQQVTSPATGHWTLPNIPITATNVQLEEGSIATPFEQRPIGLELSLCQRYYETALVQVVSNAQQNIPWFYKQTKRVVPTLSGGGAGFSVNTASVDACYSIQTSTAPQNLSASAEL